jgi:hypothetical protein
MGTVRRRVRNERGSVVAIMAVTLMVMLGLSALAIDLAYLRDSKAEAQRSADMIALAGASAFRDFPWADGATADSARTRAKDVARNNMVRNDTLYIASISGYPKTTRPGWATQPVTVDSMRDVTIVTIPDSQKVRVWVRRAGIRTFFGKLLARPFGHVQAMATAWATNSGPTVNCLKPFVIPDIWYESDKTTQDVNRNNYWDPNPSAKGNQQDGEIWKFEPPSVGGQDYYKAFGDTSSALKDLPETGYGSGIRGSLGYPGDVGLPLLIKPQTGNGNGNPAPERMGNAFWLLDFDGNNGNVEQEISTGCAKASIGDPVPYLTGGHTGPTKKGVDDLVKLDPRATWNQSTRQVENSLFPDWTTSPRVITVGLIDPKFWTASSKNSKPDDGSTFSNFARIFLLDADGNDNIQAIFIGPAQGGGSGPTGGPLVKVLQLIQ